MNTSRAEAHEVGRYPRLHHANHQHEHRQRNYGSGDQRRTHVAEQQQQHGNHEDRALKQILLHGADGLVDQHRAVVHRLRCDACRQTAIDLGQLRRDGGGHRAAVCIDEHYRSAEHRLRAVARRRASAQLPAERHVCHFAHCDRNAGTMRDDYLFDVAQARNLAGRADQVLLAVAFNITGTDAGVVVLQRFSNSVETQPIGKQSSGIRRDVHLAFEAADGVYLGDARNLPQLRPDHPVLQRAQGGGVVRRAIGLPRSRGRVHRVQEDLAEARCNWPHRRFDVLRQLRLRPVETFTDQVAREVNVGAIGEDHGHLRQPIAR